MADTVLMKLEAAAWQTLTGELHEKGYTIFSELLTDNQCEELKENYDREKSYRKTVVMERYRFGVGEYKYFDYPLPPLIQLIRQHVYPKLVPVANAWMEALHLDTHFPFLHDDLLKDCSDHNQHKATVLILKYGKGGYNTLHQDLYGAVYFPLQAVLFLNEPGQDYSGGEFVMTQQVPRAQSKAIVLKPRKGDMLLFTTNFRPVKGAKGYYRVSMRHGVSEVLDGQRYTLGIIFHDAIS